MSLDTMNIFILQSTFAALKNPLLSDVLSYLTFPSVLIVLTFLLLPWLLLLIPFSQTTLLFQASFLLSLHSIYLWDHHKDISGNPQTHHFQICTEKLYFDKLDPLPAIRTSLSSPVI